MQTANPDDYDGEYEQPADPSRALPVRQPRASGANEELPHRRRARPVSCRAEPPPAIHVFADTKPGHVPRHPVPAAHRDSPKEGVRGSLPRHQRHGPLPDHENRRRVPRSVAAPAL